MNQEEKGSRRRKGHGWVVSTTGGWPASRRPIITGLVKEGMFTFLERMRRGISCQVKQNWRGEISVD